MRPPVVHILTFEGCPHADSARAAARAAISERGMRLEWVEVDLLDPATPAGFKRHPSPTILVGMKEVSPGEGAMDGIGCRASGAPSIAEVGNAIDEAFWRTGQG